MAYELNHTDGYGRTMAITEEMQEQILRLNAMSRIYEQTDRVLTGDPVQVIVVDDGPAPAWSDGQSIWLNSDKIDQVDLETLTQVTGLNYHELSHHLYSPRRGTDLVKWVIEQSYEAAFNILEDQRIETLMIGRYPSTVPFLTATIVRYMIDTPEEMAANYMAVRGRKYLPVEMRTLFRDAFVDQHLIPAIIDIVDQYRGLAFPRDYKTAQVLIERFQKEVLDLATVQPPKGHGGCTNRSPVSKGRPEPGKQQEKDSGRGSGLGEDEGEFIPQPLVSDDDADNSDNASESERSNTNTGLGKPAADSGNYTQEQQTTPGQSTTKPTFGSGHIPSEKPTEIPSETRERIDSVLKQTLSDVHNRRDVKQDARGKQRIIIGGDGEHSELIKRGKYDTDSVPLDSIQAARRFAHELQRLQDDCEPGWERETPAGRLNVQRVIRGCELDAAFDRWDEGSNGTDVEAVILIDRSGSMSSGRNDVIASKACWTIKRALEQVQAPVTVYAFDDKTELAYAREEHVAKTQFKYIFGNGGTDPYDSLLAAERLLASSTRTNKMVILITDGAFEADKNNEVIKRLSSQGVLTSMALIMDDRYLAHYKEQEDQWLANNPERPKSENPYTLSHGVEIFSVVSSAKDLLPFAKAVVTGAIRKRM
jgi:hypothetical protein